MGDQIVAMSASWGDRMWEVTSVESFVLNVRTRRDSQLAFQLRRMVPLDVFTGQVDKTTVHNDNTHRKIPFPRRLNTPFQ